MPEATFRSSGVTSTDTIPMVWMIRLRLPVSYSNTIRSLKSDGYYNRITAAAARAAMTAAEMMTAVTTLLFFAFFPGRAGL